MDLLLEFIAYGLGLIVGLALLTVVLEFIKNLFSSRKKSFRDYCDIFIGSIGIYGAVIVIAILIGYNLYKN